MSYCFLYNSSAWFTYCLTKFLSQRRRQDQETVLLQGGGGVHNKHFLLFEPFFICIKREKWCFLF